MATLGGRVPMAGVCEVLQGHAMQSPWQQPQQSAEWFPKRGSIPDPVGLQGPKP